MDQSIIKVRRFNSLAGSGGILRTLEEVFNEMQVKWTIVYGNDYDITYENMYYHDDLNSMQPRKKGAPRIFYTPEAYLPNGWENDFALAIGFNFIDHPNYARLPYAYVSGYAGDLTTKKLGKRHNDCVPNKKEYFACFLVSNNMRGNSPHNNMPMDGTVAREEFFNILSSYKFVASGGAVLNNLGHIVSRDDTQEFLGKCKFVIAFENQSYPGYITEKVYNAYIAGAVPLYYSHPSAIEDINKNAVIYSHDFADLYDMAEYVKKVDNDDSLYCSIFNQSLINNPNKDYDIMTKDAKDKIKKIINSMP